MRDQSFDLDLGNHHMDFMVEALNHSILGEEEYEWRLSELLCMP